MRTTGKTVPLIDTIDDCLPQTQCTKCGFDGCRPYAQALAQGEAEINRCPPGGQDGADRLAALLGRASLPLDLERGTPNFFPLVHIEPQHCIGCTLCIQACPVDAILGANKRMHTVIDELCTGCELCIPACPVDCIVLVPTERRWQDADAHAARQRMHQRSARLTRLREENDQRLQAKALDKLETLPDNSPDADRKRQILEAALARARARRKTQT